MKFFEAPESYTINDTLNPLLWEKGKLIPKVRYKLLQIAKHFADTLNVKKLILKDITISGSNASFNYSEFSDIDLHLVVAMAEDQEDYYNSKKNNYNFNYNIQIKGIDVELYVQDVKQPHYSAGIYSILDDKWLHKPSNIKPKVSHKEVNEKAENYANHILKAIDSNNLQKAKEVSSELRRLRKAGLESGGEFSVENLAFKLLRSRGIINRLSKHIDDLQSAELSLREQMKITDLLNEENTQAVVTNYQPGKSVEIALPDGTQIKKDLVKDPSAIAQTATGPVFNLARSNSQADTQQQAKPIAAGTPISVNTDPNATLAQETQEEEEEDILASGKNKDIGGDPTDELINRLTDNPWERAARGNPVIKKPQPRHLPESDELYKWLTIAGLK